jgi:hypothetical protein
MTQRDVLERGVGTTPLTSARVGAVVYVLWGVVHVAFAIFSYKAALAMPFSDVQGRLLQNAWNIFFLGIAVIGVAMVFNWRNNSWGYWIHLATTSLGDIGFVIFLIVPGHVPLFPPVLILALWIIAASLTTAAHFGRRT